MRVPTGRSRIGGYRQLRQQCTGCWYSRAVRATDRGSDRTVRHTVATRELHPTVMRCPGRPTVQRNATLTGRRWNKIMPWLWITTGLEKTVSILWRGQSDSDRVTNTRSNLNRNHWLWPMTLTFSPRRATVMIPTFSEKPRLKVIWFKS